VLRPATESGAPGSEPPVPAHWAMVDLVPEGNPVLVAGDCELLEQIKNYILPLFATRNVESSFNCVPQQLQRGARLRAEVLISDARAPAAPASE
jgi:hypothetical protein